MACGICHQRGHNRQTCSQRNITGIPNQGTARTPTAPSTAPSTVPTPHPLYQRNLELRSALVKSKWKKAIKDVIMINRFFLQGEMGLSDGAPVLSDTRIVYLSWTKIRNIIYHITNSEEMMRGWSSCIFNHHWVIRNNRLREITNACFILHHQRNPSPPKPKDDIRKVKLMNTRDENYLVYWVVGNYLIQDLDSQVNQVNYLGILPKHGLFNLKTINGHRFYLIPHRLDISPPYHPRTDKEFFIEPFCQINIHDEIEEKIFIDNGDNLSELNKWKFNALKLDYLIREVIKMGGKSNDVIESILDLHEDIKLDSVTEFDKDMAGIPSALTNIT